MEEESERFRYAAQMEQRSLREAVQQKKELNAHVKQTALEQRRDSEKKEAALTKQVAELKEALRKLEAANQLERKGAERSNKKVQKTEVVNAEVGEKMCIVAQKLTFIIILIIVISRSVSYVVDCKRATGDAGKAPDSREQECRSTERTHPSSGGDRDGDFSGGAYAERAR